jgi:hypothetical protein
MKRFAIVLVSALFLFGCSKNRSETDQASRPAAVEADNSGRNVRDRDDATKTTGDQSENEQDRTITQNVRKAVSFGRHAFNRCKERQDYHKRWDGNPARAGQESKRKG